MAATAWQGSPVRMPCCSLATVRGCLAAPGAASHGRRFWSARVHACVAFSADARPERVGPFQLAGVLGDLRVGLRDAVNVRLGLVLALAAGLALAGCGRKGALEAPPSAALPQGPVVTNPGDPPPDPSLAAVLPEAAPAPPPSPSLAAPPRQGSTPLDWLLN